MDAAYDLNSNLLKITGMKNADTNLALTDTDGLTVTALITPAAGGSPVGSAITLSYVTAQKWWVGVIPDNYGLALNTTYDAAVTIDGGHSLKGTLNARFTVRTRRQS